jgi:hypothetical protein
LGALQLQITTNSKQTPQAVTFSNSNGREEAKCFSREG